MAKKPNYLPTHDHFYGFISTIDKPTRYLHLFPFKIEDTKDKIPPGVSLNTEDVSVEFEAYDNWDLSITFHTEAWDTGFKIKTSYTSCFIEYKTSLEEMNVEKIIRQIKERKSYVRCDHRTHRSPTRIRCVVTFDPRFEKYRAVFKNEGIQLCIFSDSLRKEIQQSYSEETQDASLASFQQED